MLIRNNASETAVLSLGWTTVSIYTLPFSCWCQLLVATAATRDAGESFSRAFDLSGIARGVGLTPTGRVASCMRRSGRFLNFVCSGACLDEGIDGSGQAVRWHRAAVWGRRGECIHILPPSLMRASGRCPVILARR